MSKTHKIESDEAKNTRKTCNLAGLSSSLIDLNHAGKYALRQFALSHTTL